MFAFSEVNSFAFNFKDRSITFDFIPLIIESFSFSISALAHEIILSACISASAITFSLLFLARFADDFSISPAFSLAFTSIPSASSSAFSSLAFTSDSTLSIFSN